MESVNFYFTLGGMMFEMNLAAEPSEANDLGKMLASSLGATFLYFKYTS
jgi:hypothetical protein